MVFGVWEELTYYIITHYYIIVNLYSIKYCNFITIAIPIIVILQLKHLARLLYEVQKASRVSCLFHVRSDASFIICHGEVER